MLLSQLIGYSHAEQIKRETLLLLSGMKEKEFKSAHIKDLNDLLRLCSLILPRIGILLLVTSV
jgi:hypothetical protein